MYTKPGESGNSMTDGSTSNSGASDRRRTTVIDDKTPWTTNTLEEELYLDLMQVRNGDFNRKYHEQAKYLIDRIPIYRPIPRFVVKLEDLRYRVKAELQDLALESLDDVMKEAIGKIFENIDEKYFLLNVKRLLGWELVE